NQLYFTEELKQQIGRFDAEFLLDFFTEEVGAYFYNRGICVRRPSLPRSWTTWANRYSSWNDPPIS
ncbi:DUF2164 domain-containing protein, partial [Xanthomonas perforans]|uniref:DUF2164 domain-containing protein n=1 Tax=Xanthomonas perforans TaxID=442694 RepID=UPI001F2EF0B7